MKRRIRSSVKKRLEVTKSGNVKHRPMNIGHNKTKKTNKNLLRKKKKKVLDYPAKKILYH